MGVCVAGECVCAGGGCLGGGGGKHFSCKTKILLHTYCACRFEKLKSELHFFCAGVWK